MQNKLDKIREIIEPLFDEEFLHLIDLELRGTPGSQVLSVYADTEQGITMEEITRLTRDINDLLDMHDVIEGKYRLEVSSPGINHPLKQLWEFRKNIGRKLRVVYEESGEQNEIRGTLESAEESGVVLMREKEEVTIPMQSIINAKVEPKW